MLDAEAGDSPATDRPVPWGSVVGGLVVALGADQATKAWAVGALEPCSLRPRGTIDLCLAYNQGMAFSLGPSYGPLIAAVAVAIVASLLVMSRKVPELSTRVLMGVVAGGALGNVVDRGLRASTAGVPGGPFRGAVVDFLYSSFWPTFNIADSCVVVGGILLAVKLWRTPVEDEPRLPAP